MQKRLAVKRLTESDLTIFEFHHRRTAGKQKAINLNADVFIDDLYPQLPILAYANNGRFPVDLFVYGPGHAGMYNLQRKILKLGSYKNWRLDGEFIHNPPSEPSRFNGLIEGDFVVLEFVGEMAPSTCKAVFIGQHLAEDRSIHSLIAAFMAERRMARIAESVLRSIVERSTASELHPIHGLLLDASLEDAAFFGEQGTSDLLRQAAVRSLSRAELESARQSAEVSGDLGEAFVNSYLKREAYEGRIVSFEWVSLTNVISPFDFSVEEHSGHVEVDAKATAGGFGRRIHVSINELGRMASSSARYDIYRVYEMSDGAALLRICRGANAFARQILQGMSGFPRGVSVDSISIDPEIMGFGDVIPVTLESQEE